MFKLPIFETAMDTYQHAFHHLREFFMVSWFWVITLTVLGFLQYHFTGMMSADTLGMFSMLTFFVNVIAFTSFSVAWMRSITMDEHHDHGYYAEFGGREIRYILQGALLVMVAGFVFGTLSTVLNYFMGAGTTAMMHDFTWNGFFSQMSMMGTTTMVMQPHDMGMTMSMADMLTSSLHNIFHGTAGVLGLVYFIFFVGFAMYFMRLKMVLPSAASDHHMDLVCAWCFAKGNGARLFGIFLLATIPYSFVAGYLITMMASMHGNTLMTAIFGVIELFFRFGWFALYAGFLAHSYKAIKSHHDEHCKDKHCCLHECK